MTASAASATVTVVSMAPSALVRVISTSEVLVVLIECAVWVRVVPLESKVIFVRSTAPMASLKVRVIFVLSAEARAPVSSGRTPSTLWSESSARPLWVEVGELPEWTDDPLVLL